MLSALLLTVAHLCHQSSHFLKTDIFQNQNRCAVKYMGTEWRNTQAQVIKWSFQVKTVHFRFYEHTSSSSLSYQYLETQALHMYELGHIPPPWPLPQTPNSATHWTVTLPIPPRQQHIHIQSDPPPALQQHLPGISKNPSSPLPLLGCLCDLTGLPYYSIPTAFDHNMLRFLVFWAHILTIWELLLSTCGSLTRMHNCLFSGVSPCPDTGGRGRHDKTRWNFSSYKISIPTSSFDRSIT